MKKETKPITTTTPEKKKKRRHEDKVPEESWEIKENKIEEADVKEAIFLAQTQFFYEMKPHFCYHTLLSLIMDLTKR